MRSSNRICTMALAFAAACGSPDAADVPEEPARPVDAKFAAAVEGGGAPEGTTVSVDVFWRPDGKVDVAFDDAAWLVPGPDVLKGVEIKLSNAVLNEGKVEVEEGAEKHLVRLEGVIAPEAIDVEMTDTPPGGEPVTVRLYGPVRAFSDPTALDGEYLVRRQVFPASICPGDTPGAPYGGRNVVIDVLPTPAGARLVIDGRLELTVPEGETVAWTGRIADRWSDDGFGYDASVSGAVRPEGLALTVDLADENTGPGCVSRATFAGGKRLPDPAVIDGDYRAEYVWTDACHDDASGRFAASLALLGQDGGMIDFFEFNGGWMQFSMTPDQPFMGQFYDFGSGARIAYDGLSAPPDLTYRAVYTYPYEEPCDVTLDVTAYKRYFFPPAAE